MAEDMMARMMAMDAANSGSSGGDSYSKAEIDAKLDAIVQMLAEYVKKTDYAGPDHYGLVKIPDSENYTTGVYIAASTKRIVLMQPSDTEVEAETLERKALTLSKIPVMMSNYGITDKKLINNILSRLDALDHDTSAQSHLEAMAQRKAESAAKSMGELTYERTEDI